MRTFLLAFIPLLVAVDVVGLLPIYLGLGLPLTESARRRVVIEATLTAAGVGIGFVLVGEAVLDFLGVTVGDFQIAGGAVLLVLSIYDLLHPGLPLRQPRARPGIVPLGIPMIAGPAVLTTLLTVARTHGAAVTLAAYGLNLLVVWAGLRWATMIGRVLGEAGAEAVGRVFNLFLAAIAVNFIRSGVVAVLSGTHGG